MFYELNRSGVIICPPALEEYCSSMYKKRKIIVDYYPDNNTFYVYGKRGMYMVKNKTEIWVLGDRFPYIVRRR